MSETASLYGIEMHAISSGTLPWAEPQNDIPGAEGEISESVRSLDDLSQDGSDAHDDSGNRNVPMNVRRTDENMERLVGLFREFLEAASDPGQGMFNNNPNPHIQQNMPGRKKFFGLTKGLSPNVGSNNRYDYEQKYPRDQFGKETAENARIWLTYLDEAEAFDRERVEGWKETVDVLLVFAGLFSGVITTFISQASTNLQRDNTQVTASLQFETVQLLRAQFSGLPITNVPFSTITPTSPFTPSTNASLVNGLWFTSLAITLSTALFAVLAKQWLYYYLVSFSGTANEKVRARQLRFNGFEQWKVAVIVDLLPILLHIAVSLFLTGIAVLLFPLDAHIAWTIVAIAGTTFTLYFVSVILPVWYPECPYTTSLTIYAGILFFFVRECHRWISKILDQGFRVIWERVNFQALLTIQHLVRYILDPFRHLFTHISELARDVYWGVQRHRPEIFSAEFPKFTKWREENMKQAVSNATFLDSQAVKWLYTASADMSVHRIIARSVAVHPTIAGQFKTENIDTLSRTLEISETNLLDLRYGLCLDFLSGGGPAFPPSHWHLLNNHVIESGLEEAEYKAYLRILERTSGNFIGLSFDELLLDRLINGGGSVKLPLAMWCNLLRRDLWNRTIAAHILELQKSTLFDCSVDPTRKLLHSAGLVSFDSDELGWWKFGYLCHYFGLEKPDFSSENKSYAIRYRLLLTIYHQLTSDHPFITNKEKRQKSLEHLFSSFSSYYSAVPRTFDNRFTFFKEILCVDSFWSKSMTDDARVAAVQCLGTISAEDATLFPRMDYHEISLIYQWCSRDLDPKLSKYTSPMFTVLLLSRNRHHLLDTILSKNDPEARSQLSKCLRNLGNCGDASEQGTVIYPLLMNLLDSVTMNISLFTLFYNSSMLVRLWELILRFGQNPKQFFLLVKSKLKRKELDTLFTAMKRRERLDDFAIVPNDFWRSPERADFDRRLQVSLRVFGHIIGRPQELFTSSGAMLDDDHDNEERAQVPGPNERQVLRSVANWTKKAFGCV